MKTNIYQSFEISDEERRHLADLLDSETSKRIATRDEIKDFVWQEGSKWREVLHREHAEQFGGGSDSPSEPSAGSARHLAAVPDPSAAEDVLGGSDDSEPGPPLPPPTDDTAADYEDLI